MSKQPLAEVFGFPTDNLASEARRYREKITRSEPGDMKDFVEVLQEKVDEKLDSNNPPDTEVIDAPF
jgi:hypothetical protein